MIWRKKYANTHKVIGVDFNKLTLTLENGFNVPASILKAKEISKMISKKQFTNKRLDIITRIVLSCAHVSQAIVSMPWTGLAISGRGV